MGEINKRLSGRLKRKNRVRKKVIGTSERPRLCVFRSTSHIYAQVINDQDGRTLAEASTLSPDLKGEIKHGGNVESAQKVGALVAKRALENDIKKVVFDRNGNLYHGRIKALADAARSAGLEF
ncbi:MAG: 50S ribosomal protein L18 [Deltaproteobacteria bacterium]|nr:50S ribosomal protein L18 [Deltaproteobacteria bacterium]